MKNLSHNLLQHCVFVKLDLWLMIFVQRDILSPFRCVFVAPLLPILLEKGGEISFLFPTTYMDYCPSADMDIGPVNCFLKDYVTGGHTQA